MTTPPADDLSLRRAKTLVEIGRFDAASEILTGYLSAHPDDGAGWAELSHCRLRQRDPHRALDAAWESVRVEPDQARGQVVLSYALGRLGRWEEAVEAGRECVRFGPESARMRIVLGRALREVPGGCAESLTELRHAIRLAPTNPDCHYELGLTQQRAQRYRDMAHTMSEVLRLDPHRSDALAKLNVLNAHWERVPLTELITTQTRALAAFPQHHGVLRFLDELLAKLLRRTRWVALGCMFLITVPAVEVSATKYATTLPPPLGARLYAIFLIVAICSFFLWLIHRRTPRSVWRNMWMLCRRSWRAALAPATALWCLLCAVLALSIPWGGLPQLLVVLGWWPVFLSLLWGCWARRQKIVGRVRARFRRLLLRVGRRPRRGQRRTTPR